METTIQQVARDPATWRTSMALRSHSTDCQRRLYFQTPSCDSISPTAPFLESDGSPGHETESLALKIVAMVYSPRISMTIKGSGKVGFQAFKPWAQRRPERERRRNQMESSGVNRVRPLLCGHGSGSTETYLVSLPLSPINKLRTGGAVLRLSYCRCGCRLGHLL